MAIPRSQSTTQLVRAMQSLTRKQIPYATARAINATALSVQSAQQRGQRERFTIRREQWADRSVKIRPGERARRDQLFAIVRIETPGDPSRSDILTQHEPGGTKRPIRGRSLAVPIEVKANKQDVIRKRDRPRAFAFERQVTGPRATIFFGLRRSFMVRYRDGSGWIFRRTGRGRRGGLFDGTKVLYVLQPSVPLKPRLRFVETAERVTRAEFGGNFKRALADALETAR